MGRMKNAALIARLVERQREQESWCGETHFQKAIYFLQHLMDVPLGFPFILYKHGPFSFELRDELTALRADHLLTLEHDPRYSPRIAATNQSKYIQNRFPRTLATYDSRIAFIAQRLGPKGVVQLERLGTALYVKLEDERPAAQRIRTITTLQPHIKEHEAIHAVREVDEMHSDSRGRVSSIARSSGRMLRHGSP